MFFLALNLNVVWLYGSVESKIILAVVVLLDYNFVISYNKI